MRFKFRASAACRIAHIHKGRLNEAIAVGHYSCAPEVQRGSSRVFDEDDLICLFLYGRMLERDVPPRIAGDLVCSVRAELAKPQDTATDSNHDVVIFETIGKRFGARSARLCEPFPNDFGPFKVLWQTRFAIENVRSIVRGGMEEEAIVLGEDDD